jgi:hypothetical protein
MEPDIRYLYIGSELDLLHQAIELFGLRSQVRYIAAASDPRQALSLARDHSPKAVFIGSANGDTWELELIPQLK